MIADLGIYQNQVSPRVKRRICSFDMVAVPENAYVVTDDQGEINLCNARCLCLWAMTLATKLDLAGKTEAEYTLLRGTAVRIDRRTSALDWCERPKNNPGANLKIKDRIQRPSEGLQYGNEPNCGMRDITKNLETMARFNFTLLNLLYGGMKRF